jgi:hypothetical protein
MTTDVWLLLGLNYVLRSGGVVIEPPAGKNSIACITLPTKTASLRTR